MYTVLLKQVNAAVCRFIHCISNVFVDIINYLLMIYCSVHISKIYTRFSDIIHQSKSVELTLHISYRGCTQAWMCYRIHSVLVAEDGFPHTLPFKLKKIAYNLITFPTCYSHSLKDGFDHQHNLTVHLTGSDKIFEHISASNQ